MFAGDGPLPGREEILNIIGHDLRGREGPIRVTVERVSPEMIARISEVVNPRRPPEDQNGNNERPRPQ